MQQASAAGQQDNYQVEQSLLGSTEVQEWKVELTAADEEAVSATPKQCKILQYALQQYFHCCTIDVLEDNVMGPPTASVTVLPSIPPTGVVTSHSLVADSNYMTKVSYEFQLRRRT